MKNFLLFVALVISLHVSGYQTAGITELNISQKNNTDPGFLFLRGHKQGKNAYALQWSMTLNSGIVHYEIQSTYEDPYDIYSNWTNEGIAMNNRSNIVKFTHESVLPGMISYRVIAILNNGGSNIVSGIFSTTIE